jgi:hypothetical protein
LGDRTELLGWTTGLLGVSNRSVKMKKTFDARDFESVVDALIYAYQSKTASVFLSRDIGAD